jgi:peptidyl-prolyl cis-trans isomerase SurA
LTRADDRIARVAKIKDRIWITRRAAILAAATATALAMASAAPAQQAENAAGAVDASAADDPFNLPDNVVMLTANDPNSRKATAVVNGQVITGTDVDQRLALVLAANDQEMAPEELKRLRMQILRNLIDETLQIQAAKEQKIEVEQAEIDQTYANVAAQSFRSDTTAMDAYLKKIGSSPASMKRQINGELAWQRLLRRNVEPFVNVSEEEVKELAQRLKASRGQDEYRLGEIYLSAAPENRTVVFENAKKIIEQLRQGGSFVAYARQFSEASTAAVGGDLGWIHLAQLPTELATVTRDMSPGQLVGPVEIPGGFSILYLIDKRQVLMADPRDALLSLKQMTLELPKGTTEAQAKDKVATFSAAVQQIRGCGEADEAAARLGASIVSNDQVRARTLPAPLQDALLGLQVGQATPAFGSVEEGVRVLMLCGRDDPQTANEPNFEQLMSQIEEERVGKRAQRYLRDLRRDAIIEYN